MLINTKRRNGESSVKMSKIVIAISAFFFGCIVSTMIVLNYVTIANSPPRLDNVRSSSAFDAPRQRRVVEFGHDSVSATGNIGKEPTPISASSTTNPFVGQRILIAIAAFDFNQIPHLGEVLDAYQDLCVTGAMKVDVVIHTTVAYPVTLIDLMNSRLLPGCRDIFSITIVLKPSHLRLHLVDVHRELFYRKIDDYDLFIYTEDDIRVPPKVVGAYLAETKKVEDKVGLERSADFNIGVVRYEYNFPNNVVMDDKTRQATQNVTRVYWEHGFYPVIGKAVEFLDVPELKDSYLRMHNEHQGMFFATSTHLKAWKIRENCNFDQARNRPSKPGQPSQPAGGTQRVWMSSVMLHGKRFCNVRQIIPIESFGTLNVLHLPNKNYRRVGRYRNRTFADGTETFEISSSLLSSMRLHVELRNATNQKPSIPYAGVEMVDECPKPKDRAPLLDRRMAEYQAYADRGGILSKDDMRKTALIEER